jgi:DNA repair protein RadC
MISQGNLNSSIIHPREVFKNAILSNANSIILVHNHPSGDINPSKEDIEVTKRLREVGNLLGIKVLDHVIIGDTFYSFGQE